MLLKLNYILAYFYLYIERIIYVINYQLWIFFYSLIVNLLLYLLQSSFISF